MIRFEDLIRVKREPKKGIMETKQIKGKRDYGVKETLNKLGAKGV